MNEIGIDLESRKRQRTGNGRAWLGCLTIGLMAVGVGGCTWVELVPAARAVRVAPNEAAVADCQHVGGVRAHTRARIGFFARSPEKVAEELETMAKNDAVDLEANVVLAEGRPSIDGTQRFLAYRCPDAAN